MTRRVLFNKRIFFRLMESYPVDIIDKIDDSSVTLIFIGQHGWNNACDGTRNSDELDSAGKKFLRMILGSLERYPMRIWLVVPEHEIIESLGKEQLQPIAFRIYKDDQDTDVEIVMRIKNMAAHDIKSVAIKPKNEFDF